MILGFNGPEAVRICNAAADGHDLVCPVGLTNTDGELPYVNLSLAVLRIAYRIAYENARKNVDIFEQAFYNK